MQKIRDWTDTWSGPKNTSTTAIREPEQLCRLHKNA